jgi:hypothetical protein
VSELQNQLTANPLSRDLGNKEVNGLEGVMLKGTRESSA